MIPEEAKKLFISKYENFGADKFYRFLLNYAISRIVASEKLTSPELELMDYHDKFLILYRREQKEVYLDISRIFRKAANKIYRVMLKKNLVDKNSRFLNVVKNVSH